MTLVKVYILNGYIKTYSKIDFATAYNTSNMLKLVPFINVANEYHHC